jgi:tetratricopeptide (TPR) repeat protein
LKVASYAQVKAFYGLSMLVPLCFFGALGWQVLTRGRRRLQFALGIILLIGAMNSFVSVWICHSAAQHLWLGIRLAFERKYDAAASEMAKAVDSDPSNAMARRLFALVLDSLNRTTEAFQQAERAVELNPTESACHEQLAEIAGKQGQLERAINEARRAIELGPENAFAYNVLIPCLVQSQRDQDAVEAAADALTVSPFSAETHYTLGLAVARKGDLLRAVNQFAYALLLRPDWTEARAKLRVALVLLANTADGSKHLKDVVSLAPDSPIILNDLAWLLATHPDAAVRDGHNAVRFAEHGCAMTGGKNPTLLNTLAASYAETGRFSDAITKGEEALSLARLAGNDNVAALSENLLTWFRANQPYREEPQL